MRKKDLVFLITLFVLLIYGVASMLTKVPAIRAAIATVTATPYASISNYAYQPGEIPFYTPMDASLFTAVAQFKDIQIATSNGDYYDVAIAMDGDHLLFVGRLQEPAKYQTWQQLNRELLCINITSGQVLWQTWVHGSNLVKDENHVLYVESTSYFEDVGITAYRSNTGKLLWETRFKSQVNLDTFFPVASMLFVSASNRGNPSSYILDKATGVIKETYPRQKRYIASGAVFSNGIGIKRDNGWFGYGPVKGYDIGSGKIIWAMYDNFAVSNVAVSGNVAYFVTIKAHLLAVDIHTGHILATIAFSPAFDLTKDENGTPAYDYLNFAPAVAADNDLVTVYFADKKQLSVFRFNAFP